MILNFLALAFAILGWAALIAVAIGYIKGRGNSSADKETITGRLLWSFFTGWVIIGCALFLIYLIFVARQY